MDVGKKIGTYLKETGRTQAFLCRKAGIPATRLSLVIRGKRRLQLDEYARIVQALALPEGSFLQEP